MLNGGTENAIYLIRFSSKIFSSLGITKAKLGQSFAGKFICFSLIKAVNIHCFNINRF